jgi:hypothetical protein
MYLEDQIRRHEVAQVNENIRLQTLARKLDLENQKMKKALVKSCGFLETEIDESDERTLAGKMRHIRGLDSETSFQFSVGSLGSKIPTPSTEDDASFYTSSATAFHFSSTSTSPIHCQNPLTPPTSTSDDILPSFTLTVAPQSSSDVLSNGSHKAGPQRLSDLLQLIPSDEAANLSTVTCYVSDELLKELVEERSLY